MNRKYVIAGIVAAAVLAGGGIGIDAALSGNGGQAGANYYALPAPAPAPAIGVAAAALAPGTALVDAHGRTLYLFEADTASTSACTGPCAQVWPPLLTHGTAPTASGGAQAQLLGATARSDGTQQLTYNGHPLYHYAGDKVPGDAHGQGLNQFGASWYVVAPDGDKIDPNGSARVVPAPTAPVHASGRPGGYGY